MQQHAAYSLPNLVRGHSLQDFLGAELNFARLAAETDGENVSGCMNRFMCFVFVYVRIIFILCFDL